jgi:hypothetical protein
MKKLKWLLLPLVVIFSIAMCGFAWAEQKNHHSGSPPAKTASPPPRSVSPSPAKAPGPNKGMHEGHASVHHPGAAHHPGAVLHGENRHNFHGRNYHHFNEREPATWRNGNWHHTSYGGRFGWWWVVGGVWYWYAAPIYPYPTVVPIEPILVAPIVAEPPRMVMPPPQPTFAAAPQPLMLYWCDDPKGFAPHVQNCNVDWKPIPAPPPGTQPLPEQK